MGGLNFLNTGLLFLTAATILPLLIWLLAKRKPKRVVFPSLRFIKAGQEQEKKRTRLKNIILLIIRMLIILLVTLAAARPLLKSRRPKPGGEHPPTAIAILLDTSFSMDYVDGGKTNLERAKSAVVRINSLCQARDRLILITSDEDWNRLHAHTYPGAVPEDLLKQVGVSYSPLSLTAMVQLAADKLRETQLANREMYLFTDGQKQEYPQSPEPVLHVIDVSPTREPANLSCSGAGVLPQLVEKSRRQSLQFKLTNHGPEEMQDVLVKVVLGGTKVAEKFVSLPARQSVNQSIAIDLRGDGWQSGYVEVLEDRLSHDNRSYFAFPFQLAPHVAVVTEKPQLPPQLSSLLSVYTGAGGRIDILHPQQLSLSSLSQYQSFVFIGGGALTPKLREIVSALQARDRGALFCLGRDLASDYRAYLGSLFGVEFGSWQDQLHTLSYHNPHHFSTQLLQGTNIRFNQLAGGWQLNGQGGTTLLGGADSRFAVAKDKLLLWNFDLADQRSSFLLDAAFAVFAYRSLEFVSAVIAAGERRQLGDVVSARQITLPDGASLDLANHAHKIRQPGVYAVAANDGSPTYFSVDTPRQESEFVPMDYKGLAQVKLLDKNWQNTLFHTRLGQEIWKLLLAAALALFLLELILVKTEELRPAAHKTPAAGRHT